MFPYQQTLVEIPHLFHSVEFDGPFQKCQVCNRELFHDGQAYLIEKVFRGPETIIEIATCLPCAMEMQSSISAESMQTIQQEFHAKVDMMERLRWLGTGSDSDTDDLSSADDISSSQAESTEKVTSPDPDRWLESCILSGKPRKDTSNYQVVGMFMGDKMMLSVFPYLISSKAIEEISEKLSSETKGFMQDFIDTQFGMPPEFCNPDSPLPLLI